MAIVEVVIRSPPLNPNPSRNITPSGVTPIPLPTCTTPRLDVVATVPVITALNLPLGSTARLSPTIIEPSLIAVAVVVETAVI